MCLRTYDVNVSSTYVVGGAAPVVRLSLLLEFASPDVSAARPSQVCLFSCTPLSLGGIYARATAVDFDG